jgi:hypothetical protein
MAIKAIAVAINTVIFPSFLSNINGNQNQFFNLSLHNWSSGQG